MSQNRSDNTDREQRILAAAAQLIVHYGYDKTNVSDIAEAAGISKGAVYLHFTSKDDLFEALLYREVIKYGESWLAHIEADPQGGTIGGIYKAVLYAINHNPFMRAIVKQDPRIFGNYLRKPQHLFTASASPALRVEFLQAMQAAGAIRRDVDPQVMSHIMDMLSYGLVGLPTSKPAHQIPPFDAVIDAIAEMMDRMLTPTAGDPGAAGKQVIRDLAATARTQLDLMYRAAKEGNS
ncbi:MAG: TetR/AcrR family transcriptional regulator [Caldilinea sp. CFX5]|nr:TetR/AcrR family transcriptional regulator [Caldilinea sp. CFX5]